MHLESIEIHNFRGIEHLLLPLARRCNVLIGEHDVGKTAVLDALAVALGGYLLGFELLVPQFPAALDLNGTLDCIARTADGPLAWQRSRWLPGRPLLEYGLRLSAALVREGAEVTLPLLAAFRADRLAALEEEESVPWTRRAGYLECLELVERGSCLAWVRSFLRARTLAASEGRTDPCVGAIADAVKTCVPGLTRFYYHLDRDDLYVELHTGETLPIAKLGQGARRLLQLAAEIAWRAVLLNPQLGAEAARRAVGVVLIDEVDLGLHPAWQRGVLPSLLRAFPGLQFIVTTHSPQVLGEVPRCEVLRLERGANGHVVTHPGVTRGADSNWLLDHVFQATSENAEVRRLKMVLEDALWDSDFEAADTALAALQTFLEGGLTGELVELASRLASLRTLAKDGPNQEGPSPLPPPPAP